MSVIVQVHLQKQKSKTMKFQLKTLTLVLLTLVFTSCDDDDSGEPITNVQTTFEIIASSPDHTILEQALIDTGLDEALNQGTYTVFAPTDDAFSGVLLDQLSNEQLTNILLNHVIDGLAASNTLENGYFTTLATESASGNANNIDVYINTDSGVELNGASSVTSADLGASNGIVHVVDAVIPIPDVVTFATIDPTFDTLEAALTRSDQPDFVGTLSSSDAPAPFTVFAPTNQAFSDLLDELGATSLDDIGGPTLTSTLNSHVVGGLNVTSNELESGSVETLGDDITIDAENVQIVDQNGRTIEIVVTDVQTSNGVIHAIDRVILPDVAVESTFEIIEASPNHTILEQALIDTGLDVAVNNNELTVFAPTDAAFGNVDISGLTVEQLSNVLLNHTVSGTVLSSDLSNSYANTLAVETNTGDENNLSLYINTDNGVSLNGISNVTTPDLEAYNGVVHVVDGVITIPDVTTFALADPNFSILVDALTRENSFTYVSTLQSTESPAPFTVFAPTNDAFVDLLAELELNSLADVPTATLEATLNSHVITGANVTSSTLSSGTVSTLGADLTIDAPNTTVTDPNGRVSNIIAVDVQAGNGVIHAIDQVLLPQQ
ncbi:transforming growth factor-beta-induced protein [Psychroflexus salarius]|uniref:Transforming growth factor-beta-induced protein n=2 Tax=Psychroflexus salarius TaxID=1155689 RepID=A0A1M4U0Q2_9FLAO|nr:transforming growth factor-beta-induced protein [Psychroflexus salarius]